MGSVETVRATSKLASRAMCAEDDYFSWARMPVAIWSAVGILTITQGDLSSALLQGIRTLSFPVGVITRGSEAGSVLSYHGWGYSVGKGIFGPAPPKASF